MTATKAKPTIYDLARLAGASPSTVSAALSGAWQARRISEETALRIQRLAAEQGYQANLQARGLRSARSGLVGLILPVHDNRFFSAMSQSFEALARERGLCPVIVSTLRDPEEERRTVETLLSYAIQSVFVAGATDPGAVGRLCREAGVPHVYVDLPGEDAPSVVSDNYLGAEMLTRAIVARMPEGAPPPYFLGGVTFDHATSRRIAAFRAVIAERWGGAGASQVIACGYARKSAEREIAALAQRLGGLPSGLFVNSLTVFEGVLSHFVHLQPEAISESAVGCYDYDPFAAFLQFPVPMVRQNAGALIERAFDLIEAGAQAPALIEIPPEFIPPRTIDDGPFREFG